MKNPKILIAPSILSADFAELGKAVSMVTQAGADLIHVDIMDNHFVPNLTIGPAVLKSIKPYSKLPFDVHLMMDNPETIIKDFVEAGSDAITIHVEAVVHLERAIQYIKSFGIKAGISLVPSTPASALEYIIKDIDIVLVMSVNPGFGGQSFIESQIEKIKQIRTMINSTGKDIMLAVDGGMNDVTAKRVIAAGANVIIAGSYIFPNHYNLEMVKEKIDNLRK